MKKSFIIGAIILVVILIAAIVYFGFFSKPLKIVNTPVSTTVNLTQRTPDSYINKHPSNTAFSIFSNSAVIYKSDKTGDAAAKDFISKSDIFPKDFVKNIETSRTKEAQDRQHYYYSQFINNYYVYGSSIAVHLKNKNEVYAVQGKILTNSTVTPEKLTVQEVQKIALEQAKKDFPDAGELTVLAIGGVIFNKQLMGIADDQTNYSASEIRIGDQSLQSTVNVTYIVDAEKGQILYMTTNSPEAKQREVRDPKRCTDGKDARSCALVRAEGSQATGRKDPDNAYNIMGDVYEYFQKSFQQDSYDNRGGLLTILPNIALKKNGVVTTDCRNAFWSINGRYMGICDNMVANDVLAHEFTHGITASTANLEYTAQSGAINESISDIFATALDPDWNIGEDAVTGTLRSMSNPEQKNFPDRLFSAQYRCPAENICNDKNDYCGVHYNSAVLNKAFYLMVDGGEFNGCSIKGISTDKAHAIAFNALTTYLNRTSNYKDVYSAFMQSCGELYDETDCSEVKKALQSVELDQQPSGNQRGPKCLGMAPKKPECAGQPTSSQPTSVNEPTAGPITTNPTLAPAESSAPKPTAPTTSSVCKPKFKPDKNGCEQPTLNLPDGVVEPGPVTFTWCVSKTQAGFNFRLDEDSNSPNKPEIVKDRITQGTITVNLPEGTHNWWVHSFCQDGKNGYLSIPTGRSVEVRQLSQEKVNLRKVIPTKTPIPATPVQGGAQQRILQ